PARAAPLLRREGAPPGGLRFAARRRAFRLRDAAAAGLNTIDKNQETSMPALTLEQANKIVAGALAKARAMKIKPLAVVVLDDSGNVKAAQREDGASMFRFDVAQGK